MLATLYLVILIVGLIALVCSPRWYLGLIGWLVLVISTQGLLEIVLPGYAEFWYDAARFALELLVITLAVWGYKITWALTERAAKPVAITAGIITIGYVCLSLYVGAMDALYEPYTTRYFTPL